MTEEEVEQQSDASPETEPGTRPAAAPPAKKPAPLIIMAAALLLLLLIVGVTLYFLLFADKEEELAITGIEETEYIADYLKHRQSEESLFYQDEEPKFTKQFLYKVNLADQKHMLNIAFNLMLYDQLAINYLMAKRLIIDDKIASLLSQWTADELRTRAGLELLKREIYKELNALFDQNFIDQSETKDRNPVKKILISEFYVN